jgi:hypothetical protein
MEMFTFLVYFILLWHEDKYLLTTLKKIHTLQYVWHTPKFLVRPKVGPTMLKSGSDWNLMPLLASSIKGGERGMLKALGLD